MARMVEQVASQYAGMLKVGTLNIDEHPAVAQRYGITGSSTLLFFQDGTVVDTVVGAGPRHDLQQHVDRLVRPT